MWCWSGPPRAVVTAVSLRGGGRARGFFGGVARRSFDRRGAVVLAFARGSPRRPAAVPAFATALQRPVGKSAGPSWGQLVGDLRGFRRSRRTHDWRGGAWGWGWTTDRKHDAGHQPPRSGPLAAVRPVRRDVLRDPLTWQRYGRRVAGGGPALGGSHCRPAAARHRPHHSRDMTSLLRTRKPGGCRGG